MKINFKPKEEFASRHIGPDEKEAIAMLECIGLGSLDELISETIPENIRSSTKLELSPAQTEKEFLYHITELANKNNIFQSYIGMGYHNCIIPPVILRNILENPGWYTAYTPYQSEIAQGRLEALIIFQTMVIDLTGMEIANASLLDEATAAAEAMIMMYNLRKGAKKNANTFFVSDKCHPQSIHVLKGRAIPRNIELTIGKCEDYDPSDEIFGALIQYPDTDGAIYDHKDLVTTSHKNDIAVCFVADLLSLALLTPPSELGADIVVGTTQRFGVPIGYGGPHAAYFATKEEYKRQVPGRIIGSSIDSQGDKAYRMSLQTREQHIKRERATSNICTSQVLLAVIAGMYAVYHGPEGIKNISAKVHGLTKKLASDIANYGYDQINENYFDTLKIKVDGKKSIIQNLALKAEINFRYFDDDHIGISLDETTEIHNVLTISSIFANAAGISNGITENENTSTELELTWPENLIRNSNYLTHGSFNKYHSETNMLRFLKQLENKDLSLTHSMISLGSCTMKLNATSEMIPISLPGFANIHPFAPLDQAEGYQEMIHRLGDWLCEITGFDSISFQPNSGAQGEFAGLIVIREYLQSKGENRNVALIPSSAHGTNPASAIMAGMKVIIVKCDENGNIDIEDLKTKAEEHKDDLAAFMVTYPSTHGVFEETIIEVCNIIHENGGQVYMDGANLNAQLGLTNPGIIGADVCHLNLHKTFCIPHGGGGPGMGPIGVAKHLAPFLPGHAVINPENYKGSSISAATWGSPGILPISYGYVAMMGGKGLTLATKIAILNANYIKTKLQDHFNVLYTGHNGRVAHEMIIDCRSFKLTAGIEVEDIAKRLIDYGFHAPTVSFPVPGTLMIEPTESESKAELDKFCDAMIHIRNEIKEIEDGTSDKKDNVLKNSPHTIKVISTDKWDHAYSREKAAFPVEWLKENKFWSTVGRVDNAYGDRNLICSCNPIEEYLEDVPQV